MGLNIKNERVHALARRAADVTGRSQTSVIEEALTLLLQQLGADPMQAAQDRRSDLVQRCLAEIDVEVARTQPGEIARVEDLYDETTGLPR